jgi:hypothetical protein
VPACHTLVPIGADKISVDKNKINMKTLLTTIMLSTFALTGFSQDTTITKQGNKKPKATYQVGSAKIIVWENKTIDGKTWKNYQVVLS